RVQRMRTLEIMAKGFLNDDPRPAPAVVLFARRESTFGQVPHDVGIETGRNGEIEQPAAAARIPSLNGGQLFLHPAIRAAVTQITANVAHALQELRPAGGNGLHALVARRDRLVHVRAKGVIAHGASAHSDYREARVEQLVVRQIGDGRHELAVREIAARAEDDHGARPRAAYGPFRGLWPGRRNGRYQLGTHSACTAWPPNSWRSAAITFAPNDSSWRERSRASSDSVMTGAGTFRSIASCTVHRPSPESST